MNCNYSFNQTELYGEKTDEITSFLNEDNYILDDENKRVLLHHIDSVCNSKEFQLPSLGKEYEWLNTERPLSLEDDLGKKVCVIDFFTYCCINCIHILPYLKGVETKYAENPGFAVIGIHSAKFPNERNLQQVREALLRHDIKHPVLNDPHCTLWETFSIVCWPTVFIVGPDRILLFVLIGETQIAKLPFLCDLVLQYFESISLELDSCFLPISQVKEKEKSTEFLFPGNVSTDGEKVLVSDTGHNRLIVLSRFLEKKEIIGSGDAGFTDGSFETATFNSPHGTVWSNGTVFVADTGNHSIRKVCFQSREVSTVYDGRETRVDIGKDGHYEKFRSPWDLCLGHLLVIILMRGSPKIMHADFDEFKVLLKKTLDVLYIAVAGSHQIWSLDISLERSNDCLPFAGSGREENRPNSYRLRSGFAQPSGITYNQALMPDNLFVADSESSTIKTVSLIDGAVRNVVGGGLDPTDLFQFGDKDGRRREVRLQHPMSVCVLDPRTLIIADTYNHKIKLVDVTEGTCRTVQTNKCLNEPSGICLCNDSIVIADTNNHQIVTIPLTEIFSENIPEHYDLEVVSENCSLEDDPQTLISIAHNGRLFCRFNICSSRKYILNEDGPQKLDISFKGDKLNVVYNSGQFFGPGQPSLIFKRVHNLDKISGLCQPTEMILTISMPVCDKQIKTCCYKKVLFKLIIDNTESTNHNVCLKLNLTDELKLFQ